MKGSMNLQAAWLDMRNLSPVQAAALGSLWHFEHVNKLWHHTRHWTRVVEYPVVLTERPFEITDDILDVGAGETPLVPYLAQYCHSATGIDLMLPSEGFIKKIQRSFPNVRYDIGDITKLPYTDESFDRVFCVSTLEHVMPLAGVTKGLQELVRVAKKTVFITFDMHIGDWSILDAIEQGLGARIDMLRTPPTSTGIVQNDTIPIGVGCIIIDKREDI